jgi:hypothetical protein
MKATPHEPPQGAPHNRDGRYDPPEIFAPSILVACKSEPVEHNGKLDEPNLSEKTMKVDPGNRVQ